MKMNLIVLILFCSLSAFGAIRVGSQQLVENSSTGGETHYESFRVLMMDNVLSRYLIIDKKNKTLAMHILRRIEFGERFVDFIGCNNPSIKVSVEVMNKCLGMANHNHPEDFSTFYRNEIDAVIDILSSYGFLKKV